MLATLPTLLAGPALEPRTSGILLLILGAALLVASELARRQRKKTGDRALLVVEFLLGLLAGVCFALARRYLR